MSETNKVLTHPIQTHQRYGQARVPAVVSLRAHEVYCELHGPQIAMVTGGCRGGFGEGELLAYLYARSFPKEEWRFRFEEALHGMENLT